MHTIIRMGLVNCMKILITGGTSGIGYQVAETLSKRGHFVYLTTHTKEQCLELSDKIKNHKLKMICFKLDITKEEDRQLIDNLDIDVLVNHAGIGKGGSILDMPISFVKENYEVNVFSSFALLQRFYQNLRSKKKKGKVVITSSLAGILPLPFLGSYCSTKASISMLAETLRKELKWIDNPLQITLVELGAYHTGFNQVMIDNKEEWITEASPFFTKRLKITAKQKKLFALIEKKNLSSAVKKMVKEIESPKPKFKVRTPLLQKIGAKLYLMFFK